MGLRAHRQRVSTTFLTRGGGGGNHVFLELLTEFQPQGHQIWSPTFYQIETDKIRRHLSVKKTPQQHPTSPTKSLTKRCGGAQMATDLSLPSAGLQDFFGTANCTIFAVCALSVAI